MDLKTAAQRYKEATDQFLLIVGELSEGELDASNSGGWTARQVIHHVADSEAQSYARLRRLIAEPGTQIQGYDEGKWAENQMLAYKDSDVTASIEVFAAVRKSSYLLLQRLTEEQLDNKGVHTESGEYSVHIWLSTYTNHPKDHADQIRKQLS